MNPAGDAATVAVNSAFERSGDGQSAVPLPALPTCCHAAIPPKARLVMGDLHFGPLPSFILLFLPMTAERLQVLGCCVRVHFHLPWTSIFFDCRMLPFCSVFCCVYWVPHRLLCNHIWPPWACCLQSGFFELDSLPYLLESCSRWKMGAYGVGHFDELFAWPLLSNRVRPRDCAGTDQL